MSQHRHHRSADRPRPRALRLSYQVADALTEVFLYCGVVFTPWAFGTTQAWSIRVMNGLGYLLGALLLTKGLIRWIGRYQPARWDARGPFNETEPGRRPQPQGRWLITLMAVLTVLVLAYCLVSAVNARAAFYPDRLGFEYYDHYLAWLPHSSDGTSTWKAFWMYLGWALTFWAARDWLRGLTPREELELDARTRPDEVNPELATSAGAVSKPPIAAGLSQAPLAAGETVMMGAGSVQKEARTCQRSEDRGQRTEDRGRRTEETTGPAMPCRTACGGCCG